MKALTLPAHAVLAVALLVLHFLLHPLLVGWPGAPDLLVGGLLLGALHMRAGHAALLGATLGLLEGALALRGLGALMIVYTLLGYAAARSRDLLFSDARSFLALYVILGVWSAQLAVAFLGAEPLDARFALVEVPLSAVVTAAICWFGDRMLNYFVVR